MYGQSCQSVRALISRFNITISHALLSPEIRKGGMLEKGGGGGGGGGGGRGRLALLFALVGKEMDTAKNGL